MKRLFFVFRLIRVTKTKQCTGGVSTGRLWARNQLSFPNIGPQPV